MRKGFKGIVLNVFTDVVVEFKFDVHHTDNTPFDVVRFVNKYCIIRFMFNSGYVICDLINPAEARPGYQVFPVWRFLYPDDKVKYSIAEKDINGQVVVIRRLLLERFEHVLYGDFSWTDDFKANEARMSNKVEYMSANWPADHPVRRQFYEGHPDWEKDFDACRELQKKA